MLLSDNDCADAIQEAVLKAYKSISTLKHPEFFKTWFIRILINECKKINVQKNKVIPMEEVILEKLVSNGIDESLAIQQMLNLLENELRDVVILYYFEDLPIKDISGMLKIPQGTVKSRLSRARQKLSTLIKTDFEGSDNFERKSI